MTASPPHHFLVSIDRDDIDSMGHVNNASYLKWVQDAVLNHWRHIAAPAEVNAHLWVALKHEIIYRKPAFLNDHVVATVSLERVLGASAYYETLIRRDRDLLAEVRSRWCCLDAATLRPTRLAAAIVQRFFPYGNQAKP